jgi:hypothetical protein
MNDQLRPKAVTRALLAVCVLLATSPCWWGCRDKESEPGPAEQVAESNAQETVAETITAPQEQPAVSSGKIPLRVLYVGLPETERQRDFVTFLGRHFTQVETADYNSFKEEQTKDCDVAIFDKDGLEWKSLDINVSGQYSRATVSLGVPGAFWVRSVSRKMGYM